MASFQLGLFSVDRTPIFWSCLAHAGFCSLALRAEYEHFTWWSLASFTVLALLCSIWDGFLGPVFFFFTTLQVNVILGVLYMSWVEQCEVFTDAHSDLGATAYFFGNGVMHYLPSLVAIWLVPTGKLDLRWSRIGVEVLLAYGVFAVWLFQHNPYKVYQCRTQGPNAEFDASLLAIGSTVVSGTLVLGLAQLLRDPQSK